MILHFFGFRTRTPFTKVRGRQKEVQRGGRLVLTGSFLQSPWLQLISHSHLLILAIMTRRTLSNLPSLVCAFSASATTGGTAYAFGLYAEALKKSLELKQSQLDSISTAFFVAGLFSWIPGMFVDRFGTKIAISSGGFVGAMTIMLYWAVARKLLEVPHALLVPALSILGILIFLSCAMVTGAVFKIIVSATGPGSKGSAVGAAKGYVGLGAGLYACMFQAIQGAGESELDFLPMTAFFFICCASIPALMLLPSKAEMDQCTLVDESTSLHFRSLYGSLIAMASLIIITSMLDLYDNSSSKADDFIQLGDQPKNEPQYARAFLLVTIWLAPIYSLQYLPRADIDTETPHEPLATVDGDIDDDNCDDNDVEGELRRHLPSYKDEKEPATCAGEATTEMAENDDNLEEEEGLLNDSAATVARTEVESSEPNMNLAEMLMTPSAWLMLWTTTILVGAGTVETNNMGQMVESLGFPNTVTSASLAFFSVAQAAGRVVTGSISEAAIKYTPRPFFLVMASIVGLLAHLLLGFASSKAIFVLGATLAVRTVNLVNIISPATFHFRALPLGWCGHCWF